MAGPVRGSAVLVHGLWGNPGDWEWVRRRLETADVHVEVPDLPSHLSAASGLMSDADAVREVIRSCPHPVVAVGWSYGGSVISMAAAGEQSVSHLIYVSDIPSPPQDRSTGWDWIRDHPHVHLVDGGTFVLDNDLWLDEEASRTFPEDVKVHLRQRPRRPVSWAATDPQTEAGWKSIPTTVLIGRHDQLLSDEQRSWAAEHLDDVRVLETDHFVIFRDPDSVSRAVIEVLDRHQRDIRDV